MSGRALPTFLELLGPRDQRSGAVLTILLGAALLVTTLIGAETALGFVFDPRYRDFPFAALTMAVVPFATLMLLNRPQEGRAADRRGRIRRPAGGGRALHGVQRRLGQLAIAVDLRGVFSVRGYAVAGAGRANPKISRPSARPDRPIL